MDTARYAALFQAEAREHLAEIDAALLSLEDATRTGTAPRGAGEEVATLFRGMHTIKGMAGSMGYAVVERLAHALESRCEPLRRGEETLHDALLALLFEATDLLRTAVDDVARGAEPPAAVVAPLLVRLRPPVASSPSPAVHSAPSPPPGPASHASHPPPAVNSVTSVATAADAATVRHVDVCLVDDCPLKGVRALLVLTRLQALGQVRATHPEQARWPDDRFDGRFRVVMASEVTDDALAQAVRSAGDVAQVEVRMPASAMPSASERAGAAAAGPARTVRIDARRLDTLLDLTGELVITRDRLVRAIEALDHPDRDVLRAVRDAARLVGALQDEVLQTRLLPVGQVFDRFPRLVRDVSHDLGKEVTFTMEGRDIELDRSLLDAVGDPILHLLRNALDHGIEDAAERVAAGKPARGTLTLRAVRDRASVVMQVQDDGRGIDRQAVLERARAQGLVSPEVQQLDDDALLRIIAHPGFSTARRVTNLSGRGVGVDVVNTRVRALGGQLELESIESVGTVVTLRLPVSLAITRALLVEVRGHTFAVPAIHVEEAAEYHESLRGHHRERPAVTVRDDLVPLVALDELFGLARSSTDERHSGAAGERHLVIVEAAGRRAALLVDTLVAQQDIVVKPLDVVHGAAPWFSGATVLGDGSPALIIDVPSIV